MQYRQSLTIINLKIEYYAGASPARLGSESMQSQRQDAQAALRSGSSRFYSDFGRNGSEEIIEETPPVQD